MAGIEPDFARELTGFSRGNSLCPKGTSPAKSRPSIAGHCAKQCPTIEGRDLPGDFYANTARPVGDLAEDFCANIARPVGDLAGDFYANIARPVGDLAGDSYANIARPVGHLAGWCNILKLQLHAIPGYPGVGTTIDKCISAQTFTGRSTCIYADKNADKNFYKLVNGERTHE